VTDLVNGAAKPEPLDGWVIVLLGARTLIGKEAGPYLEPVYELQAQVVQQGQSMGMVHIVMPVLLLSSVRRVDVSTCAEITIPVASLSSNERRSLAAAVARCEDMLRGMRASDAGIALAPAGVKLSPLRKA
jgi:hypothetical protein